MCWQWGNLNYFDHSMVLQSTQPNLCCTRLGHPLLHIRPILEKSFYLNEHYFWLGVDWMCIYNIYIEPNSIKSKEIRETTRTRCKRKRNVFRLTKSDDAARIDVVVNIFGYFCCYHRSLLALLLRSSQSMWRCRWSNVLLVHFFGPCFRIKSIRLMLSIENHVLPLTFFSSLF